MAKYNREFLVPYLHDLCALYFAERKLNEEVSKTKSEIVRCSQKYYPKLPSRPAMNRTDYSCLGWALCVIATLSIVPALFMSSMPFLCFVVWAGIVMFEFLGVSILISEREEYVNLQKQYDKAMEEHSINMKKAREANERNASMLPSLETALKEKEVELDKVQCLIRYVYSANVIPKHYRDFYATVFLYDWFAYSGADDLDMALNTYVLEEIKARLDRIIEQQSEMILNQRLMLAKQQESIDAQNRHSDMMRRRLNQLQATEEERLRYERMTEANTAATAYFAAATYLKS